MYDNQLIALIIQAIIAGEATAGAAGTPVKQAFQPTNQGVNIVPTAYLYKVGDKRVGSVYRANIWDMENEIMVHTESQLYETTFQISTLATQDPGNVNGMTASDLLNRIASILQSDTTLQTLQTQDVGIVRILDVRNPYFEDDRARHEAEPSMDFSVRHNQVVTSSEPVIQSTEFQILEV